MTLEGLHISNGKEMAMYFIICSVLKKMHFEVIVRKEHLSVQYKGPWKDPGVTASYIVKAYLLRFHVLKKK